MQSVSHFQDGVQNGKSKSRYSGRQIQQGNFMKAKGDQACRQPRQKSPNGQGRQVVRQTKRYKTQVQGRVTGTSNTGYMQEQGIGRNI